MKKFTVLAIVMSMLLSSAAAFAADGVKNDAVQNEKRTNRKTSTCRIKRTRRKTST